MMRKVLAMGIACLPFNGLRIFAYKLFLGYQIKGLSRIGAFNLILCDRLEMMDASIGFLNIIQVQHAEFQGSHVGHLNKIRFLRKLVLRKGATVRSKNSIFGSSGYESPFNDVFSFSLGENSLLTSQHYMDCSANVTIGSNVVFGGINSQVWTHGFDVSRNMILGDVQIGNNVYIGSAVQILQNVQICDRVIVGAGSIVSKSILDSGFYVSSGLQKKADLQDYSMHPLTVQYNGAGYIRK